MTHERSSQERPRPLRRVPLRGLDDPPRARPRDAARPPGDSSLATAADALADRDFAVAATPTARSPPTPRRHRRPGHRPPVRPEVGGDRRRLAPLRPRRARRDRALRRRRRRPRRPRRDRAGQVRQQPRRAPRPLRHRRRERDRPGLRAPPRAPPPGCSPTSPTPTAAGADLLARVAAACFYRAGTLAATQRRPRPRPHLADRQHPRRPARRRHRARRRPRRRPRRLRPLRRRLHRRARPPRPLAQPRLLGRRPAFAHRRRHAALRAPPPTPAWAR